MFQNVNEYFDELQNNPNREKPVVEYVLARMNKVEVGVSCIYPCVRSSSSIS